MVAFDSERLFADLREAGYEIRRPRGVVPVPVIGHNFSCSSMATTSRYPRDGIRVECASRRSQNRF
jgi:hypothetical protein